METPAWEIITAGKWQGRWDICVCSMTPTAERAEVLDFVLEYYAQPATIVVNADDNRIASGKDLTGMKVGAQAGTSYERYLQKDLTIEAPNAQPIEYPFGELTVVPYDSEVTAFQDLALGAGKRIDAIVSGYLTAKRRSTPPAASSRRWARRSSRSRSGSPSTRATRNGRRRSRRSSPR